jgi:hypothetical protein
MPHITESRRSSDASNMYASSGAARGAVKLWVDRHAQCVQEFEALAQKHPEAAQAALELKKAENLASWEVVNPAGGGEKSAITGWSREANELYGLLKQADLYSDRANDTAQRTHQAAPQFKPFRVTSQSLKDEIDLTHRERSTAISNIEKTVAKLPPELADVGAYAIRFVQWLIRDHGDENLAQQVKLLNEIHGLLLDFVEAKAV